jgi:chemotaxis protein methyltransferase CheR
VIPVNALQPPAPRPVLAILAALVEERTGIHYASGDLDLLADKAGSRAAEAGFDTLLDYYYFLRYDPAGEAEIGALTDALVVCETYFFREHAQLEVLAGMIGERVAAGHRPRVWSAACATGEEPLTLAMLLAQRELLPEVDLVASDISPALVARAKAGRHSVRALRSVPDGALAERFLRREPDGSLRSDEELRRAIQWRTVNLASPAEVARVGPLDFIVCRNVLIYFSDATATRVVETLGDRLLPGGALFVGISESLLRFGTSLQCEERSSVFYYRKPM